MTTIPVGSTSGPVVEPYAELADVTRALGALANRLPSWVSLPEFVSMAHAQVVEALGATYLDGIPEFDSNGLTVVRWAEARLAAAEILDAIRINLTDEQGSAADVMRERALEQVSGPIVGFPVGVEVDDDGDPATPTKIVQAGPRVSSFTPMSAFPDPYEAARKFEGSESRY